jgi:hypothetical protein
MIDPTARMQSTTTAAHPPLHLPPPHTCSLPLPSPPASPTVCSYAVRPEDVERLAPSAEVVWFFDNDLDIGAADFDLERVS